MIKCPSCEQAISEFRIKPVNGIGPAHQSWKCIAYTCPHCSTAISAQMDPLALNADILNGVRSLLAMQPR